MLNHIIQWSLLNRWVVAIAATVFLIFGMYSSTQTPVDVFPDFAPTQVVVQTEAPGFAPEEVEALVTLPIESALNGTANVKTVRAISTVGISVITVIFQDGTNVFTARQLVSEKIQLVRDRLPSGVEQPLLAPITTATGDVLRLGLTCTGETSLMDLRTLADWTIKRRLMALPGVANVVIYGGEVKQYQVLVNPNSLKNYNVSLDQVIAAAAGSNSNAAGGYLRKPDEEFIIRGIGRARDINDIAQTVVSSRAGTPILLSHIARVEIGPAFKIGDAIVNGRPGVIVNITKQPWANTLKTTYAIESALNEMHTAFPADVKIVPTFRQADFIEVAIKNVLEALVLGGILVVIVLLIFLQSWRTALISLTAIPLSLLAAVVALKIQGGTINTMTLGGLAIAIGEVVDDAIVDVENVYRRLRENGASEHPRHPIKVVYDASREIRSSVVYATFIIALVFLPIFSLGGLEGRIFSPLAFSYLVAIVASLLVALTVTPALSLLLLGSQKNFAHEETATIRWMKGMYAKALQPALNYPKSVIAGSLILFMVSFLPLTWLGKQFLPEFDEANLIVATNAVPGTSLSVMTNIGQELTKHLYENKEVVAAGQRAGRAEGSDDYGGSNYSEIDLRLKESTTNRHKIVEHIREHFARIPGLVVNVGSYISHRMDHVLSGVNAAIAIKIFGPDLDVLHEKAGEVEKVMRTIAGAVDVQVEPIIPIPQISIKIDRQAAARYGLVVGDLARTVEAAFRGTTVSQVLEGQQTFDLFVWFQPEFRNNIDIIKSTLIDTPSGAKIPIGNLATVTYGTSPNTVRHEAVSRLVVVQANVSGRDLGNVINDGRKKVAAAVKLPAGYYIVWSGQFEAQEQASRQLAVLSVIAVFGIFAMLLMAFRTASAAWLVMANLPLALVGGIWAIVISGGVLSVGSLVGFITLFGISTRNGLMLVSHFNHLLAEGNKSFDDVLWEGSLDRLVPVLMTASTAALGVLPIAVLGGAGRELEQPLAIVILGGMVSSTVLTLLVIPALFKVFGRSALKGFTVDAKQEERMFE